MRNYIKLLTAAYEQFYKDSRLSPSHVSLYMALFQEWNISRFAIEFYADRHLLMKISKIGSTSTYHRCIVQLHDWGYLIYYPSFNPFKGSRIRMQLLEDTEQELASGYDPKLEQLAERYHPTTEQLDDRKYPVSEQACVSNIKHNKPINIKTPNRQEVILFFKNLKSKKSSANHFFDHYHGQNWVTGDGASIKNWKSLAKKWIDTQHAFEKKNKIRHPKSEKDIDFLKTTNDKDYGQPL